MTYEETLARFKAFGCEKCSDMEDRILEALEKQVPKKPVRKIFKERFFGNILVLDACPTCGSAVEVEDNEGVGHEVYPTCRCGQIIDWTGICEGKWNDYEEVE